MLGLNGDPGPKGLKGDTGYQGFNGTNGERGQKGSQSNWVIPLACYDVSVGDKGGHGQRGDPGDRGPRGLVGKMCSHMLLCFMNLVDQKPPCLFSAFKLLNRLGDTHVHFT